MKLKLMTIGQKEQRHQVPESEVKLWEAKGYKVVGSIEIQAEQPEKKPEKKSAKKEDKK